MPQNITVRHNVKITGAGTQPMIFAHGFGCDQNMWRFVAPAFHDDYRVILFDYAGCGKADPAAYDLNRHASLEGYARDVLELIEALDLSNVIFVGHSVSSVIGILAAIQRPELFDRLILVGPSPRYINDLPDYAGGFERSDIEELLAMMDKNYLGWASFLAPVITRNPERPEIAEELVSSFCSTDPVTARRFAEATFFADNRDDLARVRTPSLILQCTDDAIAPREVGEYIHRKLPGSALKLMQATGHCPHMSHPGETIDSIREYLKPEDSFAISPAFGL